MFWCQVIIAVLFIVGLLLVLHVDVNGRPAKHPTGFAGVVSTLIVFAIQFLLYWGAGAFSLLLK